MNTVEDAYNELGKSLLDFVAGRSWDTASCSVKIYNKMASTSWCFYKDGQQNSKAIGWGDSSIDAGGAGLYLRDNLLQTTGQRIWGLTFTLWPTASSRSNTTTTSPRGTKRAMKSSRVTRSTPHCKS